MSSTLRALGYGAGLGGRGGIGGVTCREAEEWAYISRRREWIWVIEGVWPSAAERRSCSACSCSQITATYAYICKESIGHNLPYNQSSALAPRSSD